MANLGLIGCGGIAGAHARGYRMLWEKGIRTFSLEAVCDIDPARAEKMADVIEEFSGKRPRVYTQVETLLAQEHDVQAVDICAVHRVHHDLAVACLDAGRHVTIEKPLAITLRAGRLIMEAAARSGRLLQVAENYRRSPDERAINWAIRSGRLGKLRMLLWVDVGERQWHWGWRDELDQAGGGWTLDGGVHFADLFRYHVGEVISLTALSRCYAPIRYRQQGPLGDPVTISVEDTTMATLTFDGDVTGTWVSTNAAPGRGFQERAIYGEEGSITWGKGLETRSETLTMQQLREAFVATLSADEKEQLFPRGITDTIATELKEFVDAVRGEGSLEIDGLQGFRDQAISMAVYESAAAGRTVTLAEVEDGSLDAYQAPIDASLGLVGGQDRPA